MVAELKTIYGVTAAQAPNKPAEQSLERDIAELLNISKRAAKFRIYRARIRLGLSGPSLKHRDLIRAELV